MKLSFSTLGCPAWTLARVIDAAGRLGYDGVELRFLEDDDALWARPELTGARPAPRRGRASPTPASRSPAWTAARSSTTRTRAPRGVRSTEAERVVGAGGGLGAPGIRVFGDRVQPGADLDSTRRLDRRRAARRCATTARPAGVEVWLETHGDFAPAAAARRVLDRVGRRGRRRASGTPRTPSRSSAKTPTEGGARCWDTGSATST